MHDPAKVVLDLAVAVALGGDALADAGLLRAEPGVYGSVASEATISRTVVTLAKDAGKVERAVSAARKAARGVVWARAGAGAPDHEISAASPLVVDIGGMTKVFGGVRAPSTYGTFLRSFTFGHVRQLDAVHSRSLTGLAAAVPRLLAGTEAMAFVDVDDTIREVHGYAKQGAGYGYTKVKGLNAQLAVLSSPTCAPVIAGARLRAGNTISGRGAARLIGDAVATARAAGATGQVMVRADSGYYRRDVIAAAIKARPGSR